MRLKIASRSSDLARIQAFQVARALLAADPGLNIEFEFRSSLGDQNLDVPLASLESKGVFTQDFFEDLKAGRFDMVVHSWKDLPTESRQGTEIAGTLKRADCRDVLLVPKDVWARARECGILRVLSSSPRRAYNLQALPELLPAGIRRLEFVTVRGNVPTRIEKMFHERAALVLAKAALDRLLTAPEEAFASLQARLRLQLSECRFLVLPLSIDPPAAAQGALAIEIASGREDLKRLLGSICSRADFSAVEEEREILRGFGGGCHQKIGVSVLAKPCGLWRTLRGLTDDGRILNKNELQTDGVLPKAISKDRVFPTLARENSWFDRKSLPLPALRSDAVWVARAEAWPESWRFDGVVWTSGLASWKKLAGRGIWVHGCAENLGAEDPLLDAICGRLNWVKLTHADAGEGAHLPTVASYRLVPKDSDNCPDLRGKTHFFWMSGSAFRQAWKLFPKELADGYHGCGPGLTYEFLRRLELRHPPKVFLDLEAFLGAVIPS